MAKRIILDVVTPLADRVILTRDRWREIIRYKHPALAGHQDELGECLRDPDAIRRSAKDPDVHLYYRTADRGYICAVIGGEDRQQRFVITAYFTQSLKAGRELWKR
jgi:hypothetical protein